MSRTSKDLKSHKNNSSSSDKTGKPRRKLTPFILDASRETGERHDLAFVDNDISQDGYNTGEHWHNAKTVRALRRQKRAERQREKTSARQKLKAAVKQLLKNTQ